MTSCNEKYLKREITLRHDKYLYEMWQISFIHYHKPFARTRCNVVILCTGYLYGPVWGENQ